MRGVAQIVNAALELVFPVRDTQKAVRALRYSSLRKERYLRVSVIRGTPIGSLVRYRTATASALVLESKFHANRTAHMLLGKLLASYLLEYLHVSSAAHIDPSRIVLVPIPLGHKRQKEREYNQVEEVCRCVLPYFDAMYTDGTMQTARVLLRADLLTRTRDTLPQTSLSRAERLENMYGVFKAQMVPDPSYLYIVVDDVLTTGATMRAAVKALRKAGAERILPLTLAH